jgi:hypothetical protein
MESMQRFVRPNVEEVAVEVMQGEAVLIHLGTGHYYSMDRVGAEIWQMIDGHGSVDEMVVRLSARYGASSDQVRADVNRLVDELLSEHLVCRGDGPRTAATGSAGDPHAAPGCYEPPRLAKYSDMADMLALDPPLPGLRDIPWRASDRD